VAAAIEGVPYALGSVSQLEHTASTCRSLGSAVVAVQADVRDDAAISQALERGLERFGTLDILVNCAGIVSPSGQAVHEISASEWDLMLGIDLSGTWRMLRAVAPTMLEHRNGSIINVSSTAGMVGYRYFAAYVAAKHGVIGLTRAAALDFAALGIRVNALCPGSVRDDVEHEGTMMMEIARSLSVPIAEHERIFAKPQPMNRLVDAQDVAAAAVWLASDDSRNVTGAVIAVDGGFTAK
jgi:NAD(P)-dependent dehydrogenase (short-subunit alcohol dehydrogenase family)